MKKTPNITQMTAANHSFEGFAVRMSRNNHHFRLYVSASARDLKFAGKKQEPALSTRRKAAYDEAVAKRDALKELVDNKRSWREGQLANTTHSKLTALGFTIDVATPATA